MKSNKIFRILAMAIILSLIISMLFGGKIIRMLRNYQVGESVRDLGLEGQKEKALNNLKSGVWYERIIIYALLDMKNEKRLSNKFRNSRLGNKNLKKKKTGFLKQYRMNSKFA